MLRFVQACGAYRPGHIAILPQDEAAPLLREGVAVQFAPVRREIMSSMIKKGATHPC